MTQTSFLILMYLWLFEVALPFIEFVLLYIDYFVEYNDDLYSLGVSLKEYKLTHQK